MPVQSAACGQGLPVRTLRVTSYVVFLHPLLFVHLPVGLAVSDPHIRGIPVPVRDLGVVKGWVQNSYVYA
jgi:hypothetical protein